MADRHHELTGLSPHHLGGFDQTALRIVPVAFIRELMRKAALFAADEGDKLVVEDRHLDEALRELTQEGGELTKRLLGASRAFT